MFQDGLLFGQSPLMRTPSGVVSAYTSPIASRTFPGSWASPSAVPVVLAPRPQAEALITPGPTAPIPGPTGIPPVFRSPWSSYQARDPGAWMRLPGPKAEAVAVEAPGSAPVVVLAPRPKAEAVETPAFDFDPSKFGYDPNRKTPDLVVHDPATGSVTTLPSSPGSSAVPLQAGMFDLAKIKEAMKKPSFWIGSAAFAGMMIFLATTNNGGSGRPRRRPRKQPA